VVSIARLDPGDGAADALDDPAALVAEDDREDDRQPSEPGVVVGVADADGLDPDQDLVVARVVEVELLDRQLRARLPGDGCLDLHAFSTLSG
jgi:hypothetical protein